MALKQISVFIENREGRICDVTEVVKNTKIDIKTISLADNSDYGMLRMIVDDAELCLQALKEAGYYAIPVDVIGIKMSTDIGKLHDIVEILTKNNISIEYLYTLHLDGTPCIIIKVGDNTRCIDLLSGRGFSLLDASDLR